MAVAFSRWALGRSRSPIARRRCSPRRQRHLDRLVRPIPRDQQLVQIGELVDTEDHDLERTVGRHLAAS